MPTHSPRRGRAAAFTLVELIVVIVVLGVLAGVAIPKYYDYTTAARTSADEASIAGINEALSHAYLDHRVTGAGSSSWITALSQVAGVMDTGELPHGITISGSNLVDQRGNTYALTAETAAAPAHVDLVVSGGGS